MNVAHLLRQTIYVARANATNAYGDQGYAAALPVPARVEWSDGVAQDGEGEQAVMRATIVTESAIGPKDRVWLPRKGELAPRADDVANKDKARMPGSDGCEPAVGRDGLPAYYVTKV